MSSGTLVIQTAFLGDVVLTTGLLHALAGRFGPVDVVTTPAGGELLATHPAVRRVHRYDKRGADRGPAGFLRLARTLRAERYARAYLPHRSLRSALLAVMAAVPERTGFAGGAAAWSYTRRVPRPATGHEAERLLALAGPDGGSAATVSLALTEADRREALAWKARAGVTGRYLVMAPGSIWGTKRWPGYAALAAELPDTVVAVGSAAERALAEAVAGAAGPRGHAAAGQLSLRGAAALIEGADALVTNDSAPLHLASAVGTPVVAIFGPTVPAFGFGPRGAAGRVVELADLGCRPCSRHGPATCPLGHHRCMRDLPVARVREAVDAVRRGT